MLGTISSLHTYKVNRPLLRERLGEFLPPTCAGHVPVVTSRLSLLTSHLFYSGLRATLASLFLSILTSMWMSCAMIDTPVVVANHFSISRPSDGCALLSPLGGPRLDLLVLSILMYNYHYILNQGRVGGGGEGWCGVLGGGRSYIVCTLLLHC